MDSGSKSLVDVCRCCLSANGKLDMTAVHLTEEGQQIVYNDVLVECFGISLTDMNSTGLSKRVCESCVTHIRDAYAFRKQVLDAEKTFREYEENFRINENTIESDNDNDIPLSELVSNKLFTDSSTEIVLKDEENRIENAVQKQQKTVKHVSERKRVTLTCDTVLKATNACPFRHHKSWFQCFYCTEDFIKMDQLRDHTLKTHPSIGDELKKLKRYPRSLQIEVTNLKCVVCDLSLSDVEFMTLHFVEKHNKLIYKECLVDYKVNSSPYCCHICGKQFHVFRNLTTHLNIHYANCICDVCGKSFLNSKRLKVHIRTHEKGHFSCPKCGKILKTKLAKANHMGTHVKRVLKCQICLQPMKHYNDRIKHMSEIHNITNTFKCVVCDREFKVKHYLATHMRQTHGNKTKKCQDCGMAFITNYGLKKHMLRHTGAKEFKCLVCSKSYARSYTLKEHMRTHDFSATIK